MSMFCFQCQETAKGTGCTKVGVCGKKDDVARMQDLLIHVLKGISYYAVEAEKLGINVSEANSFVYNGLFRTITNANFDKQVFVTAVKEGLKLRDSVKKAAEFAGADFSGDLPDCAVWSADSEAEFEIKS
ncbi:MAG TPA: hydroxylamine reductase, partial [Spirochaeta sp.]|nr:hydroxylamine reductase [Spirochaeta sp.]